MHDYIIKTEKLGKKYKNCFALQDASIAIEKGNIYGLVGENGAGKTTLIKLIAGLIKPTFGKMYFQGDSSEKALRNYRKKIGFIIETPYLNPDMTAYENLNLQRLQKGIVNKGRINEVISIVGLDNSPKKVREYSLGMKQRLGIAIALLENIEVLVLDEPTNGLDPVGILEFRKLIATLNEKCNITVIISSHILSELEHIITDVIFISKSKVIKNISMNEVKKSCEKKIVLNVSEPQKIMEVLDRHGNRYEATQEGKLHIYGDYDIKEIAQYVFENGCQTYELTERKQTLEQYYMSVIGEVYEEHF